MTCHKEQRAVTLAKMAMLHERARGMTGWFLGDTYWQHTAS